MTGVAMTARQREWADRAAQRRAECRHDYSRSANAGILGLRNFCACGDMFIPHHHFVDDGCVRHPERNGHGPVELAARPGS